MQNKSNRLTKSLGAIAFALVSFSAAQSVKAECWDEAAEMYGIDPYLLKAIGWKESRGHVGAVGSLLKDGNRALGLMQINTIHMPTLRKQGIRREDLFDPCTSQKVGAWVLADCLKKKGDVWVAVGCYYGGPASRAYTAMRLYAKDVKKYFEGYKRKAGLPMVYQPYNYAPQFTQTINTYNATQQTDGEIAYQNTDEAQQEVRNSRIIQFN